MKIAVAMSGGVDSSVAAAILADKYGKDSVFGVTMKLFCYGEEEGSEKSCCSLDAIADAAAVCKKLGIAHYVINLEKEFQKAVINDFVEEYRIGKTPNPCIRCNQVIKFEVLLAKVEELGADRLATGHYARIEEQNGQYLLKKGLDPKKDQSYFLYNIKKENLEKILFPIGELKKSETRELAEKYDLRTAQKAESQDICFINTTTQDFLSDKILANPGKIVDTVGKILGAHNGLSNYTIGQRKGLGGGFSDILYVTGFDIDKNEVIVGKKEELYSDRLSVDDFHWLVDAADLPISAFAKIRYNSEEADCTVDYSSEGKSTKQIQISFKEPQLAITPGQSVVVYNGDVVLGGGIISYTRNILPK